MAKVSTRGKNVRTTPSLTLLLWQDALLSWGIPLFLGVAIGTVALLGALNQISQTMGTTALGWLLLLLIVFFPLRTALTATVEPHLKVLTLGFGLAWVGITWAQLYFAVFVGQEIFAGALTADSVGISFSLGDQGTVYDLVVEGSFAAAIGEVGREAGYRLLLEKDGQRIEEFDGIFSEHWTRRRLGRRGRTTSHQLHNHVLHRLRSPGEGMYQFKVVRVDPQLTPTLNIALYRDTYPEKTFWLLSALILIGAYIVEVLYAGKEVPLVLLTVSALVFVLTLRNLGPPPHGYQNLIGAVMIAAITGPLGGGIFRYVADFVSRRIRLSVRKAAAVSSGKGKGAKAKPKL